MATATRSVVLGRVLPGLGLVLGLALAADGEAAGPQRWRVAPAGPCAEASPRNPCPGGACTTRTPARSRFEPTDVAAPPAADGGLLPPEAKAFSGPGSCADPSTPCGRFEPTRVAERPPAPPPPGAPGPAQPPGSVIPPPPAQPPAPPAPSPPSVVEPPVGPGTLPGLP
jgi:hypothetical protein